jgi:hypothetical protein
MYVLATQIASFAVWAKACETDGNLYLLELGARANPPDGNASSFFLFLNNPSNKCRFYFGACDLLPSSWSSHKLALRVFDRTGFVVPNLRRVFGCL